MIPKAPFEHKLKLENDAIIALEPNSEKFFVKNADARLEPYSTAIIGNKGSWNYTDHPNFNTGTIGQLRIVPQTGEDCSGCYLKNIDGTNKGKTLLPNVRTINTTNHTITEDFILQNDSLVNSAETITGVEDINNWVVADNAGIPYGTLSSITIENGRLKIVGTTDSIGYLMLSKNISLNLSTKYFLKFDYEASINGSAYFYFSDGSNFIRWCEKACVNVTANNNVRMVLPIKAAISATGSNPNGGNTAINYSAINFLRFGFKGAANTQVTFYVDNASTDVGKSCYLEMQVPDNLADSSLEILCDGGGGYQTHRICRLDSTYSTVSVDTTKLVFQDGTLYDYVFSSSGRSVFLKGDAGATVNGLVGQMTYSLIKGVKKHIGFSLNIPPSDNDKTNFNKIKLRFIVSYNVQNKGLTTYEFSNDNAHFTGLQNIEKPLMGWTTTNGIEFYMFDRPLKVLSIKEDESKVYEVVVGAKENTRIYHGYISYKNKTTDSNSDGVPDVIDAIERMCKRVEEVKDYWLQVAFNPTVTTNDFSIQLADCEQSYSVVAGSVVKNGSTILQPIRTENGIDYYNVAGISTIKVKENDNRTMECKVWDTVTTTNTDETTWKRVYDINHVFTGNIVIDNGLVRMSRCYADSTSLDTIRIYIYDGLSWINVCHFQNSIGNLYIYPFKKVVCLITYISSDKVVLTVSSANSITCDSTFTIKRGLPYIELSPGTVTAIRDNIYYYPNKRFILGSTIYDALYENNISSFTQYNGYSQGSDVNQYHVFFSSTDNCIKVYYHSSNATTTFQGRHEIPSFSVVKQAAGIKSHIYGAILFDCTKIFTDVANMVGGDVV